MDCAVRSNVGEGVGVGVALGVGLGVRLGVAVGTGAGGDGRSSRMPATIAATATTPIALAITMVRLRSTALEGRRRGRSASVIRRYYGPGIPWTSAVRRV